MRRPRRHILYIASVAPPCRTSATCNTLSLSCTFPSRYILVLYAFPFPLRISYSLDSLILLGHPYLPNIALHAAAPIGYYSPSFLTPSCSGRTKIQLSLLWPLSSRVLIRLLAAFSTSPVDAKLSRRAFSPSPDSLHLNSTRILPKHVHASHSRYTYTS